MYFVDSIIRKQERDATSKPAAENAESPVIKCGCLTGYPNPLLNAFTVANKKISSNSTNQQANIVYILRLQKKSKWEREICYNKWVKNETNSTTFEKVNSTFEPLIYLMPCLEAMKVQMSFSNIYH